MGDTTYYGSITKQPGVAPNTNNDIIEEYFNVSTSHTGTVIFYAKSNSNATSATVDTANELEYFIGCNVSYKDAVADEDLSYAITTDDTVNDRLTITAKTGIALFVTLIGKSL